MPSTPGVQRFTRRRRLVAAAAGGALALNAGCYAYAPIAGAPAPGQVVSLELSDAGRVAVGERLGPGVVRVEGRLVEMRDSTFVLGVTRVATVAGGVANWAGERVTIPQSAVMRTSERKLSKGRSFLAAGIAVAAIVAFAVTREIFGFGPGDSEPKPPPIGES